MCQQREHPPIHIERTAVEKVESFKVLGVHITDTEMVHPHRQCSEGATVPLQPQEAEEIWPVTQTSDKLYRCTIESILSGCITAWYGNCTDLNRKALQRVVWSAQLITGGKLPALHDTYSTLTGRPNRSSRTTRRRGQYRCIKSWDREIEKQLLSQGHHTVK